MYNQSEYQYQTHYVEGFYSCGSILSFLWSGNHRDNFNKTYKMVYRYILFGLFVCLFVCWLVYLFVCLFVCWFIGLFVLVFSSHSRIMKTSPLPVNGCKFWPISALKVIEQWGLFSVPHLLWQGASVYTCNGHLWGPITSTPIAERLAVELSLPVFTT